MPLLLFEQMCEHARRDGEHEVCGVLVGAPGEQSVGQVVVGQNVATEPAHRFMLDAATLLRADHDARAQGSEIIGFYHSHPNQAPFPSLTDRAMMWDDVPVVIIAVRDRGLAVCGWQQRRAQLQPCLLQIESATGEAE
ncbi:MAG: M67 family metallopeptidase [Herpetosiphonaceae bacterium]|nr:M67 family metallopeptidase [Herpetosiphonaceae bacterium]